MKHKMKRVSECLYECVYCGAEAEGWLEPLFECTLRRTRMVEPKKIDAMEASEMTRAIGEDVYAIILERTKGVALYQRWLIMSRAIGYVFQQHHRLSVDAMETMQASKSEGDNHGN